MMHLTSSRKKAVLQAVLLAVGALALVLGIAGGEVKTITMKAIYICLECIGIG